MCLLMVAKPGALPSDDDLVCACVNNPDGFGYAIHTGRDIITGRGMNADDVIDRFLNLREKFINGYALFHARITTHGSSNKENCHPFRVGDSRKTILAHNGILSNVSIRNGDTRSDTRIFAEDILPSRLYALDQKKKFKKLERWAGSSKIAILNTNKDLKKQLYIINESLGKWDSRGLWWSNDSYKFNYMTSSYGYYDYSTKSKGKSYAYVDDVEYAIDEKDAQAFIDDGTLCSYCHTWFSESDYFHGYCQTCWSCIDCKQFEEDCFCHRPASMKRKLTYGYTQDELYPYY